MFPLISEHFMFARFARTIGEATYQSRVLCTVESWAETIAGFAIKVNLMWYEMFQYSFICLVLSGPVGPFSAP